MIESQRNASREYIERRRKPRIKCAYPAIVRDLEQRDSPFEERAVLSNLSAGGLYLHLGRVVEPGHRLFVLIDLASHPTKQTAKLVARGVVVRSEPQPNGQCGIALQFEHYHIF